MTRQLFTIMLLLAISVQATKAQKQGSTAEGKVKVVLYMKGNQTFECSISQLDSITFVGDDLIIEEEHEWVDLGLPSGTLWATCNVGANSPEEYGDYFAWGETEPKNIYDFDHYKFSKGSGKMTKYCTNSSYGSNGFTDDLTELEPEDDAATANWGSDWQMPSKAQIEELIDPAFTETEWTEINDFYGKKITSKENGNWIFFPAAGYRADSTTNRKGSYGSSWSRSLYENSPNDAYDWGFTYIDIYWGRDRRYLGQCVRPVRVQRDL